MFVKLGLFVFLIVSHSVHAQWRPPFCIPEESWKTVDRVDSLDGSALLGGVVSYRNYAYAVGTATLDGRLPGEWVIRRSVDYGETWSTVRVLQGGGRGIAVDPRNGHLYSIGAMRLPDFKEQVWIVRKSIDNGNTWRTVDNLFDPSEERFYMSGRITVDGLGNVIVIGEDSKNRIPVMRRSEDGGATWSTITFASKPFIGSAIAATNDGQVVVAGGIPTDSPDTVGAKWVTLHSPNGKSGWKVVDLYVPSPSNPVHSSFASGVSIRNGRVVVAGNASRGFEKPSRMIVREARLSSITSWSTTQTYQPFDPRLGVWSAVAEHIQLMSNSRYLLTGFRERPGSSIQEHIALDKRSVLPLRLSDRVVDPYPPYAQFEYIYTGGLTRLSNGQALAGYLQNNDHSKSWIIRKMNCPL